jgi:hypothetical protein
MAYTVPVGSTGSGTIALKLADATGSVSLGTVTSSSIPVGGAPVTYTGTIEITSAPATTYSEGDTITFMVKTTNTSYKTLNSGTQVPVVMNQSLKSEGSLALASYGTKYSTPIGSGNIRETNVSYIIPAGTVGVGKIKCSLVIASFTVASVDTANITVEAVPIIPGGTIVFL